MTVVDTDTGVSGGDKGARPCADMPAGFPTFMARC